MTLKNSFKSELESLHSGLIEVNDWMYENPETGFEEFETSKHLVNYIKQFDENVLYPTSELDTAFEITFGKEGPLIVLCVEYDALPEIGHACGAQYNCNLFYWRWVRLEKLSRRIRNQG